MRLTTATLILVLFAGIATLDTSVGKVKSVRSETKHDSAVIALAGEFRTVFANLLWIKAEQYHHEYLAHNSDWAENADVLGLDRLITKLDPHFDEAYAAGARMLTETGKIKEARLFLEEGVDNNPDSMMLHEELGTLAARHQKDYKDSLFHLKRAYILARESFDKQRLDRVIRAVEELQRNSSGY